VNRVALTEVRQKVERQRRKDRGKQMHTSAEQGRLCPRCQVVPTLSYHCYFITQVYPITMDLLDVTSTEDL
jgi:hypothetical protein